PYRLRASPNDPPVPAQSVLLSLLRRISGRHTYTHVQDNNRRWGASSGITISSKYTRQDEGAGAGDFRWPLNHRDDRQSVSGRIGTLSGSGICASIFSASPGVQRDLARPGNALLPLWRAI